MELPEDHELVCEDCLNGASQRHLHDKVVHLIGHIKGFGDCWVLCEEFYDDDGGIL